MEILAFLGTFLIGIIFYYITRYSAKLPGTVLASKFANLQNSHNGQILGIPYSEIEENCGKPSSIAPLGDGTVLKQWIATSYHLALLFDENDICLGVKSETKV